MSACNAGDLGSIPGSERSPGEGNGNPLQYSCLENPMDGGAWWATVHGVTKIRTRLRDFTFKWYLGRWFMIYSKAGFTDLETSYFFVDLGMYIADENSSWYFWLPRPSDSPGKNTGMGCHFLLQCMKVESEREVAQSCPTPSNPMDCSLPGSSVHGSFQARVVEWGAINRYRVSDLQDEMNYEDGWW